MQITFIRDVNLCTSQINSILTNNRLSSQSQKKDERFNVGVKCSLLFMKCLFRLIHKSWNYLYLGYKKVLNTVEDFLNQCGLDRARTGDLLRDRQAF